MPASKTTKVELDHEVIRKYKKNPTIENAHRVVELVTQNHGTSNIIHGLTQPLEEEVRRKAQRYVSAKQAFDEFNQEPSKPTAKRFLEVAEKIKGRDSDLSMELGIPITAIVAIRKYS